MKRWVIYIFVSIFVFSSLPVHAQESMTAQGPTPVDYTLPFSGLLPDNPLYEIKMLRDRLVSFLISDPLKKSEFDLLQANKRVNGAYELFKKSPQKTDLISQTFSKGENYTAEGIEQLNLSKKQGLDITSLSHQYLLALQKHEELLKQMQVTSDHALSAKLAGQESKISIFIGQVKAISAR